MSEDTRDIAIQALTEIKSHVKACEQHYENTIVYLKDMNSKLDELKDDISQAKGAAKLGKWIVGGVGTAAGIVGGITNHIVWK